MLRIIIFIVILLAFILAVYMVNQKEPEEIKNELIRVESPRPDQVIFSPLLIKGEARGYWFFEADFPIKLLDDQGNLIALTIARAQADWMTEDFVPFEAVLEFEKPDSKKGILVFEKDNPSGLPENEDELRLSIYFE